jgi:hypothetical protein
MNQFNGQRRHAIVLAFGPTILDREVLALDQTRFIQALPKCRDAIGVGLCGTRTEETDHRHIALLRARGERSHHHRGADQPDEVTPSHCELRGCNPAPCAQKTSTFGSDAEPCRSAAAAIIGERQGG